MGVDVPLAGATQLGSVEQPPAFLPLKELTNRSARIAQFKLNGFHPWEDNYTYAWGGEERKAKRSNVCWLMSMIRRVIVMQDIRKQARTKRATKLR